MKLKKQYWAAKDWTGDNVHLCDLFMFEPNRKKWNIVLGPFETLQEAKDVLFDLIEQDHRSLRVQAAYIKLIKKRDLVQ